MRIPSPRRAAHRRLWPRLVTLVVASVASVSLMAQGALAKPWAPGSDSDDVSLIVPQGKSLNSHQEKQEAAERLLATPMGRDLARARKKFGKRSIPGNVSVEYFDLAWLKDDPQFSWLNVEQFYNRLARGLNSHWSHFRIEGKYEIDAFAVPYREENEDLYEELGLGSQSRLIRARSYNVYQGAHSEEIPILRFQSIAEAAIRLERQNLSAQHVKDLALKMVHGSGAGLISENSPCMKSCDKKTDFFPVRKAISYYGYGKPTSDLSVATAREVMSKATPAIQKRDEAREKQAEPQMQQTMNLSQGDCSTVSAPLTPGRADGEGHRDGLVLAAAQLAAPCDPEASSSGLGKALTSADYGGVDFSTMELRYLSDRPDTEGVRYAFSAQSNSAGQQSHRAPESGYSALTTTAEDLRTWLVLDPQDFWVNLNPTEPGRIIDSALGRTNAGRAMLEADLQMKRTEAQILHPDSKTGARFWREFRSAADGSSCFSGRMWIVPGKVEVREAGDELYVLDAQLDVKSESENIDDPHTPPCTADAATDAHNEDLESTLVLPEIVKAVNTAPEYAPLRRAFLARVVAQWVRERHQQGHRTSFDDLIDSKDLGPAAKSGAWRPRQVFDDYVDSYRNKEFDLTRETRDGDTTRINRYVYGGADFTNLDLTTVGKAEAERRFPQLARSARTSVGSPVTAADGSLWLGGAADLPDKGFWKGLSDKVTGLTGGNRTTLALILLAGGAVTFGFRTRGRQRPAA